MDTFLRDLRFAARALLKHPTVFGVAVLSLGLGIAANTTVFAAIDAYLIRPIPVPDVDRVMQLWSTNPERGWRYSNVSVPDYVDWARESRTMELAASTGGSLNLAAGSDRAERVSGSRVTPNYFRVFAFRPLAGRFRMRRRDEHTLRIGPGMAISWMTQSRSGHCPRRSSMPVMVGPTWRSLAALASSATAFASAGWS